MTLEGSGEANLIMGLAVLVLSCGGSIYVLFSIARLPRMIRQRLFLRQLAWLEAVDFIGALGYVLRLGTNVITEAFDLELPDDKAILICRTSHIMIQSGVLTSALIEVNIALGMVFCATRCKSGLRVLGWSLRFSLLLGLPASILSPLLGTDVTVDCIDGLQCHLANTEQYYLVTRIYLCIMAGVCLALYIGLNFWLHGSPQTVAHRAFRRSMLYLPIAVVTLLPIIYVELIHHPLFDTFSWQHRVANMCLELGGFWNAALYFRQSRHLRRTLSGSSSHRRGRADAKVTVGAKDSFAIRFQDVPNYIEGVSREASSASSNLSGRSAVALPMSVSCPGLFTVSAHGAGGLGLSVIQSGSGSLGEFGWFDE